MDRPILSIIVPVYNEEKHLNECVDSILAQSYNSYELILVDDGSTDSSPLICDKYGENDKIKVIHKSNGGIVSARKAGVSVAIGQYIGFVDSDDWVDEFMYEDMIRVAEETGSDVVASGYIRENKGASTVLFNQCDEGYYDKNRMQKEIYPRMIAYGTDWVNQRLIHPHIVDKIFKAELIRPIIDQVDERIIWCEDMATVYPAILEADGIYIIKKAYYHYRKNESSVSYKIDRRALDLYPLAIKELLKTCDKYGGNLEKQLGYCFAFDLAEMLRIVFGMNYHKFYLFPISLFDKGNSIVIYGAGAVGWSYYNQAMNLDFFGRVTWTDSNDEKHNEIIVSPKDAFKETYDKILIAVENEEVSIQIKKDLIEEYGVSENIILWSKPQIVDGTFSYHYD